MIQFCLIHILFFTSFSWVLNSWINIIMQKYFNRDLCLKCFTFWFTLISIYSIYKIAFIAIGIASISAFIAYLIDKNNNITL